MEFLRKNIRLYEDAVGIGFLLAFALVEFSHVTLYRDIFLDRSNSQDHLIIVMAFILFILLIFVFIKKDIFFAVCCGLFVFGIGNNYVDNLVLGYHTQYIFDYFIPAFAALIVYLKIRKVKTLVSILLALLPIYIIWSFFPQFVDCKDMYIYQCRILMPYFWNFWVNLLIVIVWLYNFAISYYILLNTTSNINNSVKTKLNLKDERGHWKQWRRGESMLEKIILLAIALFVLAFILPPALTAIATAALTSVNPAVVTLFQVLTPIIAVVVVVLMFYHSTKGEA